MNKAAVIQMLLRLLGSFQCCSELVDELEEMLAGTGIEERFFTLLVQRLQILSQYGTSAVRIKEFESIGNGLFSMHLTGPGFNIRILYSFLPDRNPVLLHAFYERGGKKVTDYTQSIPVALKRLAFEKEKCKNG